MQILFKGRTVSQQGILDAMRDFDTQYADTNDYDNWLNRRTYKYVLWHNERQYPPKHILSSTLYIMDSVVRTVVQMEQWQRNPLSIHRGAFLHVGVWERRSKSPLFVLYKEQRPLAGRISHSRVLYKVELSAPSRY